ncbi:DUF3566 domain-containing protein [Glycomyces buryatensis]|uniref:DUF3566 domain-containing protein n=1 Tax=Glycomyces buryatensis TaxID=2570927 RepID=A0A4S8QIN2_9ACTN|nr:DUF3566 domain-containing protein [Glycomyces buryatensis]THV40594.1 DUF3566 domain-containing protein [Glycomyces buryatensis]
MTDAKATAAETDRKEGVEPTPDPVEQPKADGGASASAMSAAEQDKTLTIRRPPGMTPPPVTPEAISQVQQGPAQPQQNAGVASSARVADAVRAARAAVSQAAARGPRRARLRLKRVDPWSVMKFSFAVSIVLFIVMVVATTVLYIALDAMGVFDTVNDMLTMLMGTNGDNAAAQTENIRITAKGVIGAAALLGVVNMVLFTALATLGSFIYNVCADLVGGIEVTLAERD